MSSEPRIVRLCRCRPGSNIVQVHKQEDERNTKREGTNNRNIKAIRAHKKEGEKTTADYPNRLSGKTRAATPSAPSKKKEKRYTHTCSAAAVARGHGQRLRDHNLAAAAEGSSLARLSLAAVVLGMLGHRRQERPGRARVLLGQGAGQLAPLPTDSLADGLALGVSSGGDLDGLRRRGGEGEGRVCMEGSTRWVGGSTGDGWLVGWS